MVLSVVIIVVVFIVVHYFLPVVVDVIVLHQYSKRNISKLLAVSEEELSTKR